MTHPAIAVAEPEKAVEAVIEKTQKTINKLVDRREEAGNLPELPIKSLI